MAEVKSNLNHIKNLENKVDQMPILLSKKYERGKKEASYLLEDNINMRLNYWVRTFRIKLIANLIKYLL